MGYQAGLQCRAQPWLPALDRAVHRQFPAGVREPGLALMRDHGWQPTAVAFMRACRTLGMPQAFTSDNTPTGNADTERVVRTLTAEGLWLPAWTWPVTVARALATWIDDDHEPSLHSALGYNTPRQDERADDLSHGTQLPAA